MTVIDWIRGDHTKLDFPAHSAALLASGGDFLTRAFRASGILDEDNRVTAVTSFKETLGGSTGRKLQLTVEYAKPAPHLHRDLFVKFSRDFDDPRRDQAKVQMELEVLFALLSRSPSFPITVPTCYFSDYHVASGTGILITQCIPFGNDGIEPHYPKCLDYLMPDQLGHYKAIIRALGRLAGTHKGGRLPPIVEDYFPFDPTKLAVSKRAPFSADQIRERVARYAEFARRHPQLLPENVRTEAFLAQLTEQAPRFHAHESTINRVLQSREEMIAFCHWNAHVDNAWFWTSDKGEVDCGLMDWGNASQMNVAMAIWGCLSGAEISIWNDHLDELLDLFATEYQNYGGPALDVAELKLYLILYVGMMGLVWMLDAPALIQSKVADLSNSENPRDPLIAGNERARSQLLIMTAFLNLWQREDMNAVLEFLASFSRVEKTCKDTATC